MKPHEITPEALKARAHVGNPRSCWPWLGNRTEHGYGLVDINPTDRSQRTATTAHRAMYEAVFGPVAEGRTVHHTCRNRACINPEHLVALTPAEHARIHALEDRGQIDAEVCGTVSRYVGRKCRCRTCKDAWNAYNRKKWAEHRAAGLNPKRPRERAA